jgi:hypothetical protein
MFQGELTLERNILLKLVSLNWYLCSRENNFGEEYFVKNSVIELIPLFQGE